MQMFQHMAQGHLIKACRNQVRMLQPADQNIKARPSARLHRLGVRLDPGRGVTQIPRQHQKTAIGASDIQQGLTGL